MSRTAPLGYYVFAAWIAAAVLGGCAGMPLPDTSVPDIANDRRARAADSIANFEARRSFAEYQAAWGCWQRGDVRGCRQALDQLLKHSPEHLEARLLAAEVSLEGGQYQHALTHLAAAEKVHPEDPGVHHSLGLALDAMNRPDEALVHYKRAMELAPDEEVFAVSYHAATQNPARGLSPFSLRENGTVPLSSSPLTADAGLALATDEPLPGSAAGSDDRAGCVDEKSAGVSAPLLRRGAAALKQQSPDAALACYVEAIRLSPDNPQIALSAAVQSLQANYPDLAVELLSPLTGRFPGSAGLHRILGTAYYRLGDYRSSQVALQQALSLDKSSALTYFLLGCTLAKLGQQESAADHLRQARTLDPRFAATR